jgi:hypothetical protein
MTTDRPAPRRRRRRHVATGGRLLAGSVSAAAALGLMGVMAGPPTPTGVASPTTAAPAPTVPTVVVVRHSRSEVGPAATTTEVAVAPRVTSAVAAPVAASHGS